MSASIYPHHFESKEDELAFPKRNTGLPTEDLGGAYKPAPRGASSQSEPKIKPEAGVPWWKRS